MSRAEVLTKHFLRTPRTFCPHCEVRASLHLRYRGHCQGQSRFPAPEWTAGRPRYLRMGISWWPVSVLSVKATSQHTRRSGKQSRRRGRSTARPGDTGAPGREPARAWLPSTNHREGHIPRCDSHCHLLRSFKLLLSSPGGQRSV